MAVKLPVGECVGSYRILEPLGEGGQGTVYRAERGGRPYILKVLHQRGLGPRARREISLLSRLEHEHIVRFVGSDFWPEAETGHPYLVLEYVEGVTLDVWARHSGASVRERLEKLLKVARAMREAHRQGVFHRDLKLENILIRHEDGEPVVVDFGAGIFGGALTVTASGGLPPSTVEYRSPEALRFRYGLSDAEGELEVEHYEPSEADEVWALGVVLYGLLTHALPFGTRGEPGLEGRILRQAVRPPHLSHPRVPGEASALCLRLLEKAPEHRLKDDDGLCAALEELLAKARGTEWEAPLFTPLPWPVRVVAPLPAAPPPPAAAPAPSTPARSPPASASRLRLLEVLMGVLAMGVLGLGGLLVSWGPVSLERATASPVTLPPPGMTPDAGVEREVALPERLLETAGSAAPSQASTPAPVAPATLGKEEPSVKTQKKRDLSHKAAAVGAACTLLAGCSSTPVRPAGPPPGEPCPPGAVESMQRLGIRKGDEVYGVLGDPGEDAHPVEVQEGPVSLRLMKRLGQLRGGTILSGRMVFGGERVYGRLTQALTREGHTYLVCIQFVGPAQLTETNGGTGEAPGVPFLRNVGPNRIGSTPDVEAVERFD